MSALSEDRVFSGPVLAVVTHLKHVLEMNGIEAEVRGEYRAGAVGEIPLPDAWPELCVLNPDDRERAKGLVADALGPATSELPEWRCPDCNETVEGQFGQCWNCGAAVAGSEAAQ